MGNGNDDSDNSDSNNTIRQNTSEMEAIIENMRTQMEELTRTLDAERNERQRLAELVAQKTTTTSLPPPLTESNSQSAANPLLPPTSVDPIHTQMPNCSTPYQSTTAFDMQLPQRSCNLPNPVQSSFPSSTTQQFPAFGQNMSTPAHIGTS